VGRVLTPAPVALVVLLAVASWHTASNLGGVAADLAYTAAVAFATLVVLPRATDRLRVAPPWAVPVVAAVGAVALVAAFVIGVPDGLYDALGGGSDRADALDVALTELASGRYPYTATTYLGNPITPLPGALLLAAPFWWVTGSAAWQNVAWTLLLLPVLNGGFRLRPGPTALWVLAVLGGLEVLREFLIGDDLVTSVVPAVAAAAWTLRVARHRSVVLPATAAVALGVATCTRPHLALVVVVVVAAVGTMAGARRAVVVGGVAGLTWLVLIVPFLLGGVGRFSPAHVVAKVTGDRSVTWAFVVVALLTLALLIVALRVVPPSSATAVAWCCAAVLFAPTLLSLGRSLALGPATEVADLTLGAAAVPFALWAMAMSEGDRVSGWRPTRAVRDSPRTANAP